MFRTDEELSKQYIHPLRIFILYSATSGLFGNLSTLPKRSYLNVRLAISLERGVILHIEDGGRVKSVGNGSG